MGMKFVWIGFCQMIGLNHGSISDFYSESRVYIYISYMVAGHLQLHGGPTVATFLWCANIVGPENCLDWPSTHPMDGICLVDCILLLLFGPTVK